MLKADTPTHPGLHVIALCRRYRHTRLAKGDRLMGVLQSNNIATGPFS